MKNSSGDVEYSDVVVNGDVDVETTGGNYWAVYVAPEPNNSASVTVNGDVALEGYHFDAGVRVFANANAKASADISGNVEAINTSNEELARGAIVKLQGKGEASLTVGGDITANGTTDTSYGLEVEADAQGNPAVVVVGGTIESGRTAVYLENDDQSADHKASELLDLTVWKIVSGRDVLFSTSNNVADGDEGLAAAVNYIVKISDSCKDVLSATGESGALATKAGYVVAHQDDKVYLVPADGYYITKAYNGEGEGKVELKQDADGRYYYTVPAGGGVLLSAEMDNHYDITLDLGGGTLGGKTDSVVQSTEYGTVIKLPEPTREGYRFLYWEGSRYDAGAEYEVKGAHKFTAVWEKAEVKAASAPASSTASSSSMPQTGDTAPVLPVVATLVVAAAAIGASRSKLQPARAGKHARR